ncbi:MAG: ATP-binding cassette domain-containing protein [Solirubrobacteraceae bacterium]
MSLLELECVSKRYGRRPGERVALRDVSLQVEPGELVAVLGRRRSGRSTLLRIAAGVEVPDEGIVRFAGNNLACGGGDDGDGVVGYCQRSFRPGEGRLVLDQIIVRLLARGASPSSAASRAHAALVRAGAERCVGLEPVDLDGAEAVRVAIARALAGNQRLLVIDEPTKGVDLLERDSILLLLRSLANEGVAVLMSTGETPCLSGVDRGLTIGDGELHGRQSSELAEVLPLRRAAGRRVSA